jgi:pimeloyl-ACP methyl ester carboxylesterase
MKTSNQVLQGASGLTFDAITGITNAVEGMHRTIAGTALPQSNQPHGMIAASVYSTIRAVNGVLREGIDRSLNALPSIGKIPIEGKAEIRTTAALNGVFGDHLEASGNPLATPMTLMTPQHPLSLDSEALAQALPEASPHLVVLVHGLSLSELGWSRKGASSVGCRLEDELACTSLYLRYNSGRHISTNGREFAQQLQQLCDAWPVPVQSLSLIGHSMGGLVIRSACCYAQREQSSWLQHLQRVACLGSPHHGSPLEKAGHALDVLMQKIPYTAPLAFARHRSAGIKDLRHGDILDEDWQGHDLDQPRPAPHKVVPLLPDVDYYFAAASLGKHQQDPLGHLLGDLLVRSGSAMGSHGNELRRLNIKAENCRVFHEKNHFDLIDDQQVQQQVVDWFSD